MNCSHCHLPVSLADLHCPHCGEILLALPPGTRLYQQYQIVRVLRRAGGLSYQALDERRQTQVLLLEFFPPGSRRLGSLALLPEDCQPALQRWRERLGIRAQVPGAQSVDVTFEQNGTQYAVTALPVGETLADRLQAGRTLSETQAQDLMLSLALTLESLHQHGLTDGIISPERVALVSELPRLDLGWGRMDWPSALAPEQLLNPPQPQPASDVYALGVTMLAALTGTTVPGAAERAFGQPLPPLPHGMSEPFRKALELALSLRADQRPDGAALVRMLRTEAGTGQPPGSSPVPALRMVQAHKGWLTGLAADETRIFTAGTDLRIRSFDWQGQQQRSLDILNGTPVGLGLTSAGLLAAEQGGRVLVWNGQHISAGMGAYRIRRILGRPGNRALTLNDDGQLGAWDLEGPRLLGTAPLAGLQVTALHISPGNRILLGTSQGEVLLFDEVALRPASLWASEDRVPVTALVAGEGQLMVAVGRRVLAVSGQQGTLVGQLPGNIHTMNLSPAGDRIAVGTDSGLSVLSLQDHQVKVITQGAAVRTVYWGASGLAAGNDRGELLLVAEP